VFAYWLALSYVFLNINSSFLPFSACIVWKFSWSTGLDPRVHEGGDSVSVQQHLLRFKAGCLGHSVFWLTTLNQLTCRRFKKPLLWAVVLADFLKCKTFKKIKNTGRAMLSSHGIIKSLHWFLNDKEPHIGFRKNSQTIFGSFGTATAIAELSQEIRSFLFQLIDPLWMHFQYQGNQVNTWLTS